MENVKEYFDVVSLSGEDFKDMGFDASNLTDGQMQRIANKIGDACMEQFWESLRYFASELNLPEYNPE